MKLVVHRGAHEIGGSCVELEAEGHRLILDLGMPLMNPDGTPFEFRKGAKPVSEMLAEGIIPSVPGLFEEDPSAKPIEDALFDRAQLAEVIRVCRRSRSLSEAGRTLFAVSRKRKKVANDADRLRKYLARFGLDWRLVNAVAAAE